MFDLPIDEPAIKVIVMVKREKRFFFSIRLLKAQ